MPFVDNDDSDDDLDERELPAESDLNDDDDEDEGAAATCPHCGAEVYEDIERCPVCGEYVTIRRTGRNPWWLFIAAIICLLIVLEWVYHDRL